MFDTNKYKDLWKYLRGESRPVVLYGGGNGADKVLDRCLELGLEVRGIFASDGFTQKADGRRRQFRSMTVLSLAELETMYPENDYAVLLCFGSSLPDIIGAVERVAERHELYVPDMPVTDEKEIFDAALCRKNADKLRAARELLAVSPRLERLYAFEPDSRTRRRLARTVDELNAEYPSCAIDTVTAAAWSTDGSLAFTAHGNRGSGGFRPSSPNDRDEDIIDARALDSVLDGAHVDYIKYDVEGCEREALLGSADTIRHCLPELRLSLYHRPCDMWELPLLLHDICPEYRMHLFRPRCLPAWETELCAAAR